MCNPRIVALMQELSCNYDEIGDACYRDNSYEYNGEEYLVLTDDEADSALDYALDSLLDDVVLPYVDEALQHYFDRAAFKQDASFDGRGHHLNHYNGAEECQSVECTDYYIYRTN